MKRILVLSVVLLLSSALSWAQAAGTAPAPVADPRAAGGRCVLPDLAGLPPGQRAAAALNAGLQLTYVDTPAYPACPTTFACNSLAGCAAGATCTNTVLGRCCRDGGAVLCCQTGEILEQACPCQCTGAVCATSQCTSSTNVTVSCFLPPAG
jgi:hypothetical protein